MAEITLLNIDKMTPIAAQMVYYDEIMDKARELYHKYDMSIPILNFPQFKAKWILGENVLKILISSVELGEFGCDFKLFNIPVEVDKYNKNVIRLIMEVE